MHKPVLLKEVIKFLDPRPNEVIVDGTVDGGGHAREIIKKIEPTGIFLGIDWDALMISKLKDAPEFKSNPKLILREGNYADIKEILEKNELGLVDGLLIDLGFSSEQLESSGRGFSFLRNEPLIMTYSDNSIPAYQVLKEISVKELERVLRVYGEERLAGRIAVAIKGYVKRERVPMSNGLAEIIYDAVPISYRRGRLHPATRTFQAIRIYVNSELENLEKLLKDCLDIMNDGGRLVIISFHSLEDRLVKNYFRNFKQQKKVELLTKKPIVPTDDEIRENPRSRSAKLRAIIKK